MQMNKSEVLENRDKKENQGWVCPRCGKVLSPSTKTCSCNKPENKVESRNWFKD